MCLETRNCISKKNVDARLWVSLSNPVITSISINFFHIIDYIRSKYKQSVIQIISFWFLENDPNKCLEDDGNGFFPDNDCIDCSKPPKQKCANGYIMSSALISYGSKQCTKITCTKSGNQINSKLQITSHIISYTRLI